VRRRDAVIVALAGFGCLALLIIAAAWQATATEPADERCQVGVSGNTGVGAR